MMQPNHSLRSTSDPSTDTRRSPMTLRASKSLYKGRKNHRADRKSWGTWSLAVLASVSILMLRMQGSLTSVWLLSEYIGVLLISVAAHWYWGSRDLEDKRLSNGSKTPFHGDKRSNGGKRWLTPKSISTLFGLGLILLPWTLNLIQRRFFGASGEATELIWLAMLQYAAIWQASVSTTSRQDWISFLLSCFLMLFGVTTSDRSGMILIVAPFGLMAAWWLLAQYWQKVSKGFVASQSVPLVRLRLGVITILVGLSAALGTLALRNGYQIVALDGFMPTSGGQQRGDSSARQGVGDGDMLVAAKDQAYTFGPVDSDLFLDSQAPSLYDLMSEMYGEPTFRKREYSRAISLENEIMEAKEEGSESKQKGREFSALRTPAKRGDPSQPKSTHSRAILHVIGATPHHLRQECYDHFDGIEWTHSPSLNHRMTSSRAKIVESGGKPWMSLASHADELAWPVKERMTVKVINMKSSRVPSPSMLSHIHIDKVDQEDFFEWSPDGQITMPNRPYIPQLTVLHILYQTPCLEALRTPGHPFSRISHRVERAEPSKENSEPAAAEPKTSWIHRYLQLPTTAIDLREYRSQLLSKTPQSIAERWTDWQRVEGIVDGIRQEFRVNRDALPDENCDDVLEFVLKGKSGPDYLIATAAVALLRDMGIPCRLVNGFYCKPERYDIKSGLTEVLPEDLHTWVEVYCHGSWLPVEPCNTYAKPREMRSWRQWAIESAWWMHDVVVTSPIQCAVAALSLIVCVVTRRRWLNILASLFVASTLVLPLPSQVTYTSNLLRFRQWLAGRRKPKDWTLTKWIEDELSAYAKMLRSDKMNFIAYMQLVAYAPSNRIRHAEPSMLKSVQQVCRTIVLDGILDSFRIRSLQRKRKQSHSHPSLVKPATPNSPPIAPSTLTT
jgi:protein-glutamine gamma-glutamyltransferase